MPIIGFRDRSIIPAIQSGADCGTEEAGGAAAARLRSMRGEKRQPKLFSGKPSLSAATPFEREVEGTLSEGRKEKRGGGG